MKTHRIVRGRKTPISLELSLYLSTEKSPCGAHWPRLPERNTEDWMNPIALSFMNTVRNTMCESAEGHLHKMSPTRKHDDAQTQSTRVKSFKTILYIWKKSTVAFSAQVNLLVSVELVEASWSYLVLNKTNVLRTIRLEEQLWSNLKQSISLNFWMSVATRRNSLHRQTSV